MSQAKSRFQVGRLQCPVLKTTALSILVLVLTRVVSRGAARVLSFLFSAPSL